MSKYIADICVKTGTNTKTNKNFYTKVGSMFESDSGSYSIKLDVLPMPSEKGCWLNVFMAGEKQQSQPTQAETASEPNYEQGEIPF